MIRFASPDGETVDRGLVAAVRTGFADAYARGDIDALLAFYHPDYVDLSEGAAVRGREHMRDLFRTTFARSTGRLEIQPAEVLLHGDWALERGTFSIHLTDKASGAETVRRRRYLELLERGDDGRWYIYRDLDNDPPP